MIVSSRVTVGAAPVALAPAESGGSQLVVRNTGAADVLLGGSDVSGTNGFPLPAGTQVVVNLDPRDTLFGLRTGTADLVVAVLST